MDLEDKRFRFTGKKIETLHRLGLYTSDDVLSYYPIRYEILEKKPFEEWQVSDKVSFEGKVASRVTKNYVNGKTICRFDVLYEGVVLKVTIFNRSWATQLQIEQPIVITGMYQGNHRFVAYTYKDPRTMQSEVTPIYSTKADIPQRTIRSTIEKVYNEVAQELEDRIPIEFQRAYRLQPYAKALSLVHFPMCKEDILKAYRTLKYREFLQFFTAVELRKQESISFYKQPKSFSHEAINQFISALSYPLTKDQESSVSAILSDLQSTHVMNRLVQGDVGCGKTTVALIGIYATLLSGYQAALLAPTEILAKQHYETFHKFLKNSGKRIVLLTSSVKDKEQIKQDIATGNVDLVIGTHALLQEDTKFYKLGMVVADEQQRFGVDQRRALRSKGNLVDCLVMSATPIPRTLAVSLYGDMDISTIETMPPGRKPVITKYIPENSFRSVLNEILSLLKEGRQLYVITASIEANDAYKARAAEDVHKALTKLFSPAYKVGLLHGQLSSEEKEEVMNAFAQNKIQVLVSTTVVEVGVNVVNATGMIVYDADRFGLSQLHQLRGRIQRGSEQGHCYLLSSSKEDTAKQRLEVLVKSSNGFEIAMEDLRLRGPGDILGTRQSGLPDFILSSPVQDTKMMNQARKDAVKVVEDPKNPDYACLLEAVRNASKNKDGFID